jgi:hypothetical protein
MGKAFLLTVKVMHHHIQLKSSIYRYMYLRIQIAGLESNESGLRSVYWYNYELYA